MGGGGGGRQVRGGGVGLGVSGWMGTEIIEALVKTKKKKIFFLGGGGGGRRGGGGGVGLGGQGGCEQRSKVFVKIQNKKI